MEWVLLDALENGIHEKYVWSKSSFIFEPIALHGVASSTNKWDFHEAENLFFLLWGWSTNAKWNFVLLCFNYEPC